MCVKVINEWLEGGVSESGEAERLRGKSKMCDIQDGEVRRL